MIYVVLSVQLKLFLTKVSLVIRVVSLDRGISGVISVQGRIILVGMEILIIMDHDQIFLIMVFRVINQGVFKQEPIQVIFKQGKIVSKQGQAITKEGQVIIRGIQIITNQGRTIPRNPSQVINVLFLTCNLHLAIHLTIQEIIKDQRKGGLVLVIILLGE